MLDNLRQSLVGKMSEKRLRHTLEVEKMATVLGELYCPEKIPMLRGAALLHDITKECSMEQQLRLCEKYGVAFCKEDLLSPKIFHAKTAAALIPTKYPNFADEELISCVRWHTTGHRGMTLCEQLIYLADYIDLSRTFEDCVVLRNFFFEVHPEKMTEQERLAHLRDTVILSFDKTVYGLLEEHSVISSDSVDARNDLMFLRANAQN